MDARYEFFLQAWTKKDVQKHMSGARKAHAYIRAWKVVQCRNDDFQ
jgi:hypothetical protein